jgi:hypothetical protein
MCCAAQDVCGWLLPNTYLIMLCVLRINVLCVPLPPSPGVPNHARRSRRDVHAGGTRDARRRRRRPRHAQRSTWRRRRQRATAWPRGAWVWSLGPGWYHRGQVCGLPRGPWDGSARQQQRAGRPGASRRGGYACCFRQPRGGVPTPPAAYSTSSCRGWWGRARAAGHVPHPLGCSRQPPTAPPRDSSSSSREWWTYTPLTSWQRRRCSSSSRGAGPRRVWSGGEETKGYHTQAAP